MKTHKKYFLFLLILFLAINIQSSENRKGNRIPVLMYHEVSDEVWGNLDYLFVSPDDMRTQLQWLKDHGYETIFFSDLLHLSDYNHPVLLTFDDGYEGNYTHLFPLLKEFKMKATVFLPTDYIGQECRLTESQVKEMSDSGLVSIQSHTKSHVKLDELNAEQLTGEFRQSREVIRQITGKTPSVISYPEGQFSQLSDSMVPLYFSFGVINQRGPWRTRGGDRYHIPRTVISRGITVKQFAERVSQ